MHALIFDSDSERAVIAYLLNCRSEKNAEQWLAQLDAECFYDKELRLIFTAMNELVGMEQPQLPNFLNVSIQLATAHPDEPVAPMTLTQLMELGIGLYDPSLPVEVLRNCKVRRALQRLSLMLDDYAADMQRDVADTVERAIAVLDTQDVTFRHRGTPLHDVLAKLRDRVNDNQQDADAHHGPWTGVEGLDTCGGLPESGLVVLAGGTSQGKSALGALIALRSADHGMPSAYFSLELSDLSMASRMVAMDNMHLSAQGIKNWRLNDADWQQTLLDIARTDSRYGQLIYYDDSRTTRLDDICAGIRRMHHAYGIRLAVVDFLQLLNFTAERQQSAYVNIEQQMGFAARRLKNLGDSLGICVVALCQINRSQDRMRPTLGIIRDSGQIAEAADMAIFAWRPEAYHGAYDMDFSKYRTDGTMAFLVLKNREGALMERLLEWDGKHTLAKDIPDALLYQYETSYEPVTTKMARENEIFDSEMEALP